jgi:methylmalonyl-CoA decarboxylase subunit alpha
LVPDAADTPFPIGEVARAFVDEGSLFELRGVWARELSTTLARLAGQPVGIIANCSQHRAGILTVEAAEKATQFIELCDRYRLPVIFLVDVLGFAIGSAAELAGIERAGARLFAALATATTKKIVVVVRRAHTAGLFGMCGPTFDPDLFLALPSAAISVVTERGLINGLPQLERQLDTTTRAAIRGWLREQRPDPSSLAEVVPLSRLRARLCDES